MRCPHWPTCERCLQPMYDESYQEARDAWLEGLKNHDVEKTGCDYWEWEGNPPERAYYRPYDKAAASWFQVYETVSEGIPVSPAFATQEELIDYLVEHGDFWDQSEGRGGYTRSQAERFVKGVGSVPSMIIGNEGVKMGIEAVDYLKEDDHDQPERE